MFPPLRLREAWNLGGLTVKELTVRTWYKISEHEVMTRAAAVSFYAMLALVPFLALVLTVSVQFLPRFSHSAGDQAIGTVTAGELDRLLREATPDEAYKVIHDQIVHLQDPSKRPIGLILFGLTVTIWLASSLFVAIIDAMNRIYGVTETRSLVKTRVVAIVMTCIQAAILLGSLLAVVIWPHVVTWLGLSEPAALLATLVQWAVVLVMVLISFALCFFVAPDADQRWEWITPGSLLGAVIFLLASFGFRLYVEHFSDYDKTYGSLGGVMVLLFWFWISSLVLLTSAQINKIIEDASPLGKNFGQKLDTTEAPDLKSLEPETSPSP